jgi:hypothetical protein
LTGPDGGFAVAERARNGAEVIDLVDALAPDAIYTLP